MLYTIVQKHVKDYNNKPYILTEEAEDRATAIRKAEEKLAQDWYDNGERGYFEDEATLFIVNGNGDVTEETITLKFDCEPDNYGRNAV